MRLRGQRGQVTTENTVIAGIVVTATIAVLAGATPFFRAKLTLVSSCVISDVCVESDIGGPSAGGSGDPGAGPETPKTEPCAADLARQRDIEARALADLAADVYNEKTDPNCGGTCAGGTQLPDRIGGPNQNPPGLEDAIFDDPSSGFRAALYEISPGQYVLAYAGTDPKDIMGDIGTDIGQGLGIQTTQYDDAVRLAQQVQQWAQERGATVDFTGHSLGGGLAATAAMATGGSATVFNMARPTQNTLDQYGIDPSAADRVDNYEVEGEFLDPLQNIGGYLGSWLGIGEGLGTPVGHQHTIPSTSWDPISRHLMGDVKNGLDKQIAADPGC
jgi:type VI secretion system secreted protein VgrG